MQNKTYQSKPSGGFTLIELLVVVAIVGILATILIPVLQSVGESSSRTMVVANYKQIGSAVYAFAADNNGRLPGVRDGNTSFQLLGGQMIYRLPGVARDSLMSPDQLGPYMVVSTVNAVGRDFYYSPQLDVRALYNRYTMEDYVWLKPHVLSRRTSINADDSEHIYPFGATAPSTIDALTLDALGSSVPTAERWLMRDNNVVDGRDYPVHGDGHVVLFYDGHVEIVPAAKISANGLIRRN